MKISNDSYHIDETYIKAKGIWHYLYRAVDSNGDTLDWMLSKIRNAEAAERFFKQVLSNDHCASSRVIGVDKNAAYPLIFEVIKDEKLVSEECELRQIKYLNNKEKTKHFFIEKNFLHQNHNWHL